MYIYLLYQKLKIKNKSVKTLVNLDCSTSNTTPKNGIFTKVLNGGTVKVGDECSLDLDI